MAYIAYETTPIWEIDAQEFYIYTGNDRDENKHIFEVLHYSNKVGQPQLTLRKYGDMNASNFQMKIVDDHHGNPAVYAVDIEAFTESELKRCLSFDMYEIWKREIRSVNAAPAPKMKITKVTDNLKPKPKGTIMKILSNAVEKNTESAKIAAGIAAGKAVNNAVMKKVAPHLPMMLRGYADHPLAKVAVANLVMYAVQNFLPENKKAVWAADAMMDSSMVEFFESFNLEEILTGILDDVKMPGEVVADPITPAKKRTYKRRPAK